MIKVTLPDGSVKEMAQGVSPMDVAKSISEGLARNVISALYGTTIENHDGVVRRMVDLHYIPLTM